MRTRAAAAAGLAAAGFVTLAAVPASAGSFEDGKLTRSDLADVRAGAPGPLVSRTDVLRIVEERTRTQPIRVGNGGVSVIQRNTGRNARLSSTVRVEIRDRSSDGARAGL